ncbi:MAG TPA: indolepyruvate ferredoxin oxidoreductase family protein [Rhodospirillaceae bacterium]|nr:indolepyruvate ferredoxin oxidoreductase family protein [Rhodospirillaceae bacterium]
MGVQSINFSVNLDDKYVKESGYVYMTGLQALVRAPLVQRRRDKAAGLNTAGYVTGYRGSPLSAYDRELSIAQKHLDADGVTFEPGLNEDLAATALWGSQQTGVFGKPKYEGVFGIWYGKNPGLDRSGDPFKHANYAGTAKFGGVIAVVGDDHAAKSATVCNQSEYTFMTHNMPVLSPSDVQDVHDFALFGWALSRYSGCWIGFKVEPNNMDRTQTICVDPDRVQIKTPTDFEMPPDGLSIRWPDNQYDQEARLLDFKHKAAHAFVRANKLDRLEFDRPSARFGIVTAGKSYLDTHEALSTLGIDEARAKDLGIAIYKLAMPWPIEPVGAKAFCEGLEEILVVEEKQAVIEDQLRSLLYDLPPEKRPRIVGKKDENGHELLTSKMGLQPHEIASAISKRLLGIAEDAGVRAALGKVEQSKTSVSNAPPPVTRSAYFCSGCPHSSSLKRPDGSRAMAGIGCHWMAMWVPDFMTEPSCHMGGEGMFWVGQAPFSEDKHVFQNLGDGTYFHSGSMAIRAAVVAKVNITYKILYNDATAMTGGQEVEGHPSVAQITRQLQAEGLTAIAVVTDEPEKYGSDVEFASGVTVSHRKDLLEVEARLRDTKGVTALVYDQTCAAEKRRRRKKKEFPDPPRRMFINELVCEGCGDCSKKSNCISIEPQETEFGRKRKINQSSCNKDYTCKEGFCPSFVTVENAEIRKQEASAFPQDLYAQLPEPDTTLPNRTYNLLVTGIGGTGVVTVGAVLGMAAHLEGKGASILDSIGLAQKNGSVLSHIRLTAKPSELYSARVPLASADGLIGCDIATAVGKEATNALCRDHTRAVINNHMAPTANFVLDPDVDFDTSGLTQRIDSILGTGSMDAIDGFEYALALMGDAIAQNLFMLGFAFQKGMVPVSSAAIERAIELNRVAIEMNKMAFAWGRLAAHSPDVVARYAGMGGDDLPILTLDQEIERRVEFLTQYQNKAYGLRYQSFIAEVQATESRVVPGETRFSRAAVHGYFKLMAYKDEYEVARLYTDPAFIKKLKATFKDGFSLKFHLAPPIISDTHSVTGERVKRTFGSWMMYGFRLLSKLKFLRGTPLDLFGLQHERRMERELIREYEIVLRDLMRELAPSNYDIAVQVAMLPQKIRGYGHVKQKNMRDTKKLQEQMIVDFRETPDMVKPHHREAVPAE